MRGVGERRSAPGKYLVGIALSRGESKTRCSATVSSTTPRLGARWPPTAAAFSRMARRTSSHSWGSAVASSAFTSRGDAMCSRSMTRALRTLRCETPPLVVSRTFSFSHSAEGCVNALRTARAKNVEGRRYLGQVRVMDSERGAASLRCAVSSMPMAWARLAETASPRPLPAA